jgi:hypothetical protein
VLQPKHRQTRKVRVALGPCRENDRVHGSRTVEVHFEPLTAEVIDGVRSQVLTMDPQWCAQVAARIRRRKRFRLSAGFLPHESGGHKPRNPGRSNGP